VIESKLLLVKHTSVVDNGTITVMLIESNFLADFRRRIRGSLEVSLASTVLTTGKSNA
jgi:hypothetical protein